MLAVRAWLPTSVEPPAARVGCERDRRNFDEPLLIDDEIGILDRGSVDVGLGPRSLEGQDQLSDIRQLFLHEHVH